MAARSISTVSRLKQDNKRPARIELSLFEMPAVLTRGHVTSRIKDAADQLHSGPVVPACCQMSHEIQQRLRTLSLRAWRLCVRSLREDGLHRDNQRGSALQRSTRSTAMAVQFQSCLFVLFVVISPAKTRQRHDFSFSAAHRISRSFRRGPGWPAESFCGPA